MYTAIAPDVNRDPDGFNPNSYTTVNPTIRINVKMFMNMLVPHPEYQVKLNAFNVNATEYNISVVNINTYFMYSPPSSYTFTHDYPHK